MVVSKGAKTRSSQKTVLPVDADRTMVVLAHKLAPPIQMADKQEKKLNVQTLYDRQMW